MAPNSTSATSGANTNLDTIARIHAGESIVQPSVALRLIAEFVQRQDAPQQPHYDPLSERGVGGLRLLADGWTNKAIAGHLGLTEGTVKNYTPVNLTVAKSGLPPWSSSGKIKLVRPAFC